MKLLNAFSLNMIADFPVKINVVPISIDEARAALESNLESAVGHEDTAAVFGEQLGLPVPANRVTISLEKGDVVIVGQYRGPRLEEGATTLPQGSTIQWLRVSL
jgi:hypothetical protein